MTTIQPSALVARRLLSRVTSPPRALQRKRLKAYHLKGDGIRPGAACGLGRLFDLGTALATKLRYMSSPAPAKML